MTPVDLVVILLIPFLLIQLLDRCSVVIKRPAVFIALTAIAVFLWVVGFRVFIERK